MVFFIDLLIQSERVSGWLDNSVADTVLSVETWSVESGWRFSCRLRCDSNESRT